MQRTIFGRTVLGAMLLAVSMGAYGQSPNPAPNPGDTHQDRTEARQDRREARQDRHEARQDKREARQDRRQDRHADRHDRRTDRPAATPRHR
jgi:hypothetical protein